MIEVIASELHKKNKKKRKITFFLFSSYLLLDYPSSCWFFFLPYTSFLDALFFSYFLFHLFGCLLLLLYLLFVQQVELIGGGGSEAHVLQLSFERSPFLVVRLSLGFCHVTPSRYNARATEKSNKNNENKRKREQENSFSCRRRCARIDCSKTEMFNTAFHSFDSWMGIDKVDQTIKHTAILYFTF
eukprot:gene1540-925_t